jgi:hypothetical protein
MTPKAATCTFAGDGVTSCGVSPDLSPSLRITRGEAKGFPQGGKRMSGCKYGNEGSPRSGPEINVD